MENQSSLNRGASEKQFPISFSVTLRNHNPGHEN